MKPKHPGIDLLIADVPDNLVVPIISPKSIPFWNKRETDYFDHLFAFADCHFTDDALLLVFLPKDQEVEKKLASRSKIYGFTLVCVWWGINPIPMASSIPTVKEVLSFLDFLEFLALIMEFILKFCLDMFYRHVASTSRFTHGRGLISALVVCNFWSSTSYPKHTMN